jgi:hypothetical protein
MTSHFSQDAAIGGVSLVFSLCEAFTPLILDADVFRFSNEDNTKFAL